MNSCWNSSISLASPFLHHKDRLYIQLVLVCGWLINFLTSVDLIVDYLIFCFGIRK